MTIHLDRAVPVSIRLHRLEVPLVQPLRAGHGTEWSRRSILVQATDEDGVDGWGECVALARPTYTGEWHDGAWLVLRDFIVPGAGGRSDLAVVGHPMAQAAVEMALVDLRLRQQGQSLAVAVGGIRSGIVSRAMVGLPDPTLSPSEQLDALLRAVEGRLARGHRAIKLKVTPLWDEAPLSAVRSAWPGLDVSLDANGTYSEAEFHRLRRLAALEPTYLEQPLAAGDLLGHAGLRRQIGIAVALDESASDLGAIQAAIALGAVDVVNVKPTRLGGLAATMAVHDLLQSEGIGGFVGGMYELGVARTAALVVASMPQFIGPADLGPSSAYFVADVTSPIVLDDQGLLPVPNGSGVGLMPEGDSLARFLTESWTFTARTGDDH